MWWERTVGQTFPLRMDMLYALTQKVVALSRMFLDHCASIFDGAYLESGAQLSESKTGALTTEFPAAVDRLYLNVCNNAMLPYISPESSSDIML